VPAKVKKQRVDAVMALQQKISYDLNQEKIGKTFRVLFDRKENDQYVGRTEFDSPEVDNEVFVTATNENHISIGEFREVLIVDATDYDLYGTLV